MSNEIEFFEIIITNLDCPYHSKPQSYIPSGKFAGYWCEHPDGKKHKQKCRQWICPIKNESGKKSGLPSELDPEPKIRIIEYVWCLCCNHMFFADKEESYTCPKCKEILSFEKENMRYIVDK